MRRILFFLALLVLAGIFAGYPAQLIFLIVSGAGVFIGAFRILSVLLIPEYKDQMDISSMALNLQAGNSSKVRAEKQRAYDRGDRKPRTIIGLAAALGYDGLGLQAEPYARQACDILESSGKIYTDDTYTYVYEMALLVLFDAWLDQGRFREAADLLKPRYSYFRHPVLCIYFITLALVLAEQYDEARVMITTEVPDYQPQIMPPKSTFMFNYLNYYLFDLNPSDKWRKDIFPFEDWMQEAERNANNPYVVRLKAILADIERLQKSPVA